MVCDMLFCLQGEKGEHLHLSGVPPLTIKKFNHTTTTTGSNASFLFAGSLQVNQASSQL